MRDKKSKRECAIQITTEINNNLEHDYFRDYEEISEVDNCILLTTFSFLRLII